MQLLDDALKAIDAVHKHFGYVEQWRVIPLDDGRSYFWQIVGSERDGRVRYADTEARLNGSDDHHYEVEIYTQRHLPKYVYRGPEFTMIAVNTQTDMNYFLMIFDNAKERPGMDDDESMYVDG